MNSDANLGTNEDDVFCEIGALPRLPRIRQQVKINNDIRMKDIYHMKPGEFFTDIVLTGFLSLLNYKYKDTMDFSNTYFLEKVKEYKYSPDYISRVMRTRLRNKTIFDLDNYFVLNHIPPVHWGIIHVSLHKRTITCFDGLHCDELQQYEAVKKSLNILANKLNIGQYKDCGWQRKPVQTALYPEQKDGWNCGTFVAIYAYHMTINGYLPKATESEEYLTLFRKFMVSCFLETKQNKEAMLTTLG